MSIDRGYFSANYQAIKAMLIEEAANSGFGTLSSEIKPSEFNGWKGQLFFQLKTANGTDQLFIEFKNIDAGVEVYVHGAGTRSDPKSAAASIEAHLANLQRSTAPAKVTTTPLAAAPPAQPAKSMENDAAKLPTPAPNRELDRPTVADSDLSASVLAEMQSKLIQLGILKGKADGKPGKQTADAVMKFQQSQSLRATGKLDAETISKLRGAAPKTTMKPSATQGEL